MADRTRLETGAPRRRWRRWVVAAVLLVFLGSILAHRIWILVAQRHLDKLVAGYRALGEPTAPKDLENAPVRDADNAVIDLRAAIALATAKTPAMDRFQKVGFALPFTRKEQLAVDAALKEGAGVFPLVESAMTKPGVGWQIRVTSPVILLRLSDLSPARQLANFIGAAALAAHARGDEAQAARHVREGLFLGRMIDRQPPILVSHLVAIGCRALAASRAATLATETSDGSSSDGGRAASAAQLNLLRDELLDEREMRAGLRRAMQGERVQALDAVDAMLAERIGWSASNSSSGGSATTPSFSIKAYLATPLFLTDARLVAEAATTVAGTADDDSFPAASARIAHLFDEIERSPRQHVLAQIMTPSYARVVQTQYQCMTEGRLAALALAVHQYAVEHDGHLPGTLAALVPAYLSAIPLDPFSRDHAALRYIVSEPDPCVYSVGRNGTDEGGSELPLRAGRAVNSRWECQDAVLHLRRQPRDLSDLSPEMSDDEPSKDAQ